MTAKEKLNDMFVFSSYYGDSGKRREDIYSYKRSSKKLYFKVNLSIVG